MDERARRLYLGWVAGGDIAELARAEQLSRSQAHRIIAKVRDSAEVRAAVGVEGVEGPFTADELTAALREYAKSVGIEASRDA